MLELKEVITSLRLLVLSGSVEIKTLKEGHYEEAEVMEIGFQCT